MSLDCQHIIHPFQEDAGVSQPERSRKVLVTDPPRIDGRSLAELLNYFLELAPLINYYDSRLNTRDWVSFFQNSQPFLLAGISCFDSVSTQRKWDHYNELFNKKPSRMSLQLMIHFLFNKNIRLINQWQLSLKGSGLAVSSTLESLMQNLLGETFLRFKAIHDEAVRRYCIRRVKGTGVFDNPAWKQGSPGSRLVQFTGRTKRDRMKAMRDSLVDIERNFLFALETIAASAQKSIGRSILPMQVELQKKHAPHIALLFAFIKLYRYLQKDLNRFTRKHLDYFYKEVLHILPKEAVPDQAHIVFEIQKQLSNYLLKKGLHVKDGKDIRKAEILFSLEDDLVINKAQVADQRTLFLNPGTAYDHNWVEGLYIANDPTLADGIKIPFKENEPKNYSTLGAKFSKYQLPDSPLFKPYLNARIGFVMASPVLLLNEGKRKVKIYIDCELNENLCAELETESVNDPNPCCEEQVPRQPVSPTSPVCGPRLLSSPAFLDAINDLLLHEYYYLSRPIIQDLLKNGISDTVGGKLLELLLLEENRLCYCPVKNYAFDRSIEKTVFEAGFTPLEWEGLKPWFQARKVLQVSFSGEKGWVYPLDTNLKIKLIPQGGSHFTLKIKATLENTDPAVTYFDAEKLKEKIDTRLPLVRVLLDDSVKMYFKDPDFGKLMEKENKESDPCCPDNSQCCVRKDDNTGEYVVSPYHFFRNLVVKAPDAPPPNTRIEVKVCGVKNLIVQNDESVQDVNSPIYPFGTRPKIIDFDAINPPTPALGNPNLVGPNFYLGSNEIFLKNWTDLCINIKWKDKPSDFNDYYKAYLKRDNYHDCINTALNNKTIVGLNECDFKVRLALLETGVWKEEVSDRKLFIQGACQDICSYEQPTEYYSFHVQPGNFGTTLKFVTDQLPITRFDVNAKFGFLRINLRSQDFLHKDYAFVLARQMMALSMFDGKKGLEGAVYLDSGNAVVVFKNTGPIIIAIEGLINDVKNKTTSAETDVNNILAEIPNILDVLNPADVITIAEYTANLLPLLTTADGSTNAAKTSALNLLANLNLLKSIFSIFDPGTGNLIEGLSVPIPNEPWTPIIEKLLVDYTAVANAGDIDLIHLYPFKDTYKKEEIRQNPPLFPLFCDEGTLYLGLKDAVPDTNLNLLFQLAEATADTEADKPELQWEYLSNNQWKVLRKGFEVIDDATNGLTSTGILKLALPADITNADTIMPRDKEKDLFWIKASVKENSRAICETLAIRAQAILTVFTNEEANDKLRLSEPLPAGSLAKLEVADASVKSIEQPFDSFGGHKPEESSHYYIRVSELLRHKGRAIQKFDYERLVLEQFPEVYRAKCINHSFALDAKKYKTDWPIAPGYVMLAVIPDLVKVKAGNNFEPGLPVALLEEMAMEIHKLTSPFVRLRVMNPRYERINICIKVKLVKGKDQGYFKAKMEEDIRQFLAPWAIGEYSKLKFGQCVNYSDLIGFLEWQDYVDYILDLQWGHESDWINRPADFNPNRPDICPRTPRSILIGGQIDICVLSKDCAGILPK